MNTIEKTFPLQSQIIGKPVNIDVFVLGEFQYQINTEIEMNNIRLWAVVNNMTEHVVFIWKDCEITINQGGDLSAWPLGMLDQTAKTLIKLIKRRRGEDIELTYVN